MQLGASLDQNSFDAALAALGPFEAAPLLAVGWSGGGDSTALLSLADGFARAHGGRVVALHVDHGLRAESTAQAQELAQRASAQGIAFEALEWTGPKPVHGVPQAARQARRDLLVAACRRLGAIHLLLAHHADDQRETVAMRAAQKSGPIGLAGMSAIVADRGVRILRPLLGFAHADLLALCRARGLAWFEDPTNRDPRYTRARVRLAGTVPEVSDKASRARMQHERDVARLAARAVALAPGGYLWLDRAALRQADAALAHGVLARAVLCIGGDDYAPAPAALAAAWGALAAAAPGRSGRTLGHCRVRIEPDGRLLVAREPRACAPSVPLAPDEMVFWDGRFAIACSAAGSAIGALGAHGWAELPRELRASVAKSVPAAARVSLPTIRDLDGVLAVPHLSYGREGHRLDTVAVRFWPRHALCGPAFVAGGLGSPGPQRPLEGAKS
ncbi:MAG: tRNA lysidine(34) synthetase TilS [Telmatospirillum sp.]|nr:tRNA lysidine(34) synthetase TilS [Telmatospirillum sp.]